MAFDDVGDEEPGIYFRVSPKIWQHAKQNRWSEDTLLLALFFLTCKHRTAEGLFILPLQYICTDLQWQMNRLQQALAPLLHEQFIQVDGDVVLITNALHYQRPNVRNHIAHALRQLKQIPESRLWSAFADAARRYAPRFAQDMTNAFAHRVDNAMAHSITDSMGDVMADSIPHDIGHSPAPAPAPLNPPPPTRGGRDRSDEPEGFSEFWSLYPRRLNRMGALRNWRNLVPKEVSADDLLTAVRAFAAAMRGRDTDKVMHATTFLGRDRRYMDYIGGGKVGGAIAPAGTGVLKPLVLSPDLLDPDKVAPGLTASEKMRLARGEVAADGDACEVPF